MVRNAVLFAVLVVTACHTPVDGPPLAQPAEGPRAVQPDEQWIVDIAAVEPAFAGGHHAGRRVNAHMNSETLMFVHNDERRPAIWLEQAQACDRAAAEEVRRLAPQRDDVVLAFWLSAAGKALANVEAEILAWPEPTIREWEAFLADAEREKNYPDLHDPSSPISSFHRFAKSRLHVQHQAEIGAFYRSDAGRRWLVVRAQARASAAQRCAAFLEALGETYRRGPICPPPGLRSPEHVVTLGG